MKSLKRGILTICMTMLVALFFGESNVQAKEPELVDMSVGAYGTYLPYEGANYYLVYDTTEEGLVILGLSEGTGYDVNNLGRLEIPSQINGVPVVKIGDFAFAWCSGFTGELIIPGSVTTIGGNAFAWCSGFTGGLTIPNSVTTIGEGAFTGCSGFTGELTIPNGVTKIEDATFYECSGFTGELTIPNGVTTIGGNAFEGCSGFTGGLTIPNGVTVIGDRAFYECSGFSGNLTIPNGVTTIGDFAFCECSGFTGELIIPNGVTTIGDRAFHGCSGFTGELIIPNSVTTIGDFAFWDCSGFTGKLTILNGVTTIGNSAFNGCSGFTGELTIPNSVTAIGEAAFNECSGFTGDLTIPNSVTSIGDSAFGNCRGFTGKLTIPNSVTTIGNVAFWGCFNLTGVVLGREITYVPQDAFQDCSKITEVWFEGKAISDLSFLQDVADGVTLYYPAYVSGWSDVIAANPGYNWVLHYSPTSQFVERMYTVALGRAGEPDGIEYWTNMLMTKQNDGASLAQGFILNSVEFRNKNYSNEEYIKVLYKTFFNREAEADPDGFAYWQGIMAAGNSRACVLAGFVNSVEFDNLCRDYDISRGYLREDGNVINPGIWRFSERLYTKILGRSSEKEGIEYWTCMIADRTCTPEAAAKEFFWSPEYLNKQTSNDQYVETLYQTFMDRASDPDGKANWLEHLDNGASREYVLECFANSVEFKEIMARYGL